MPSSTHLSFAERARAYRPGIRAAGGEGVLLGLSSKIVTLLDTLKERRGLCNRRQALLQLIEQRRATPQHTPGTGERPPCGAGFATSPRALRLGSEERCPPQTSAKPPEIERAL